MEVAVLFTTDEVDWLWLIQIWFCCPDAFATGVPEDDELEPALSICCIKEAERVTKFLFYVTDHSTISTTRELSRSCKTKCLPIHHQARGSQIRIQKPIYNDNTYRLELVSSRKSETMHTGTATTAALIVS